MENEPKRADSFSQDSLRELLAEQFLLHEVRHHPPASAEGSAPAATVPKAHAPADVYKCLHQGFFGVGHLIEDPQVFQKNLARELAAAQNQGHEPVVENVAPSGAQCRINLGPLRAAWPEEPESAARLLTRLCQDSVYHHEKSPENFFEALKFFKSLNDQEGIALQGRSYAYQPGVLEQFFFEINRFLQKFGSIPVLGHSPSYRRLNQPSYRVVSLEVLKNSPLAHFMGN
jgi:hypothetical protein